MKRFATILCCVIAACSDRGAPLGPEPDPIDDGVPTATDAERQRFVVVVADRADPRAVAADHGLSPDYVYGSVLNGFATSVPDAARSGLFRDRRIVRLVREQKFRADGSPALSWGLDRIDQRTRPLDGWYGYAATGRGVTVYIVDSGVRYSHRDFQGRATFGFDAYGGDGSDCSGHGTHVAGTVGGATYGVAREVSLVSVRVLTCSNSASSGAIVAGLDWILQHGKRPAVVNMSLSSGGDPLVDEAVRRVIAAGIPVVAAAGNANMDACTFSPARVPEALTIGASTNTDERAYFSNYGSCLDWFAPGSSVVSLGTGSDSATAVKSGTSMAAPHTTGAAALLLERNPAATPADVASTLAEWTTKKAVAASNTRNNHLLFTLGQVTAPSDRPPVANYSFTCTGLSCSFKDGSSDPDGSIASWRWDFGDGTSRTSHAGGDQTHTFAAGGSYSVSLTVTDQAGNAASTVRDVRAGVVLTALPYKSKGTRAVDLMWEGVTSSAIDVFVNGARVATVDASTGYFTYPVQMRGQARLSIQICETGTTSCSRSEQVSL